MYCTSYEIGLVDYLRGLIEQAHYFTSMLNPSQAGAHR